ncbi:MAG: AtpZ/AtpI family protein [Anaerolineae bacterium]|jgi:F0F1-type ATP synthase assembly protein I
MKRRDHEIWREALRATSLGWDLALPIFAGVLIGHLLDRVLEANYGFTLGLLLLGIATGFYNVIRSIQRVDARSRRRGGGETAGEEDQSEH